MYDNTYDNTDESIYNNLKQFVEQNPISSSGIILAIVLLAVYFIKGNNKNNDRLDFQSRAPG